MISAIKRWLKYWTVGLTLISIYYLGIMLLRVPSPHLHHTWTVVQHKVSGICTTTSATCAVTVTSTGSGNLIIIGMGIAATSAQEAIVSVSDGTSTYVHPAGCSSSDTSGLSTDCAYTLSSTSGKTSITVTRTDATNHGWRVYATEVSFTSGPISVDSGSPQVRDQSSNSTSPAGVTLTLAGSNDVIFQLCASGTSCTAITSPYSTNQDFAGISGAATAINTIDGTAPTWTVGSNSHSALSAIAFTESSSATQSNIAGPSQVAGPSAVK